MEPNKFDNHIKSLLESREMQPSESAWSKLNDRLDQDEKPNNKKWFWLSGLAASIIGVLFMINLSNSNKTQPTIVDIETIKFEKTEGINNDVLINKENKTTELVVSTELENRASNSKAEELSKFSNVIATKRNKKYIKNTVAENKKLDVIESKSSLKNSYNTSAKTTLASVILENKTEDNELINEADKLLAEALLVVNTKETETIDAASLLYDVEVEVEQSFRTKMFAKIKENVSTLTTVIVDRNK
jgi:hypothetical protein